MSHWAASLIGQPYTPEKNCWWLVRHVFKEQLGIDMPVVAVGQQDNMQAIREAAASSGWRPSGDSKPQEFDIVTMVGPRGKHIGVIIFANNRYGLLHNLEDAGVTFTEFDRLGSMGYRRLEFWRHA